MIRRTRHPRRGYALPAVMIFLAVTFGAWVIMFRSSGTLIRVEQARLMRDTRTAWSAPAIANALRLLETGTPPSDPYECKLALTQDGETKYLLLTFESASPTRWNVTAAPTTAAYAAPDCPATFAPIPSAPGSLSATAESETRIDLTWSDVPGDRGYQVQRSPNGTTNWTTIATTARNAISYANTALTPDTTYYYRVVAIGVPGDSAASNVASATTLLLPPAAPTGLTAVLVTDTSIRIDWNDDSNTESGFIIERKRGLLGTWSQIATPDADTTTYTSSGLLRNRTYFFRVRATNSAGDSNWSNTVSLTTN